MLTRIELSGFKSFDDFGLDLRPLTAIVGPNASGKSNLFDALRFLSLLAQYDIRTAMQDLRVSPKSSFGTPPQVIPSVFPLPLRFFSAEGVQMPLEPRTKLRQGDLDTSWNWA
jgi:predicted ATP-dependent endonuclease of OLD family